MAKATIDDVAKLAGVSIKTVSRVVNREQNVRESTRERVQKAITQLSYRPNLSARNLASQRSHLIVLVYDDPSAYEIPSGGFIIRMQQGVLRACAAADYELLIHPCNYRNRNAGDKLHVLIDQVRPDGIVLAAPLSNMPKIVNAIKAKGTPLVRMSPGGVNGEQYTVVTNDREICAETTRYLVSLGHQRIAFVTGHRSHKAIKYRFLGYKDGLEQSGLPFSKDLVCAGDNSFGSGETCGDSLLSLDTPPTAVFTANDDMAAGVMRAADRRGVDIPGQLSVVGFDDISLARQIYPSLTTIRQPLSKMAERAAHALINDPGDGSKLKGTDVVPSKLMIRESTGPAPG
ncbi:MAG: LacI family DNA-binding transcriptional regulator [Woeseiaceae bacterium]|nr:LacI family DNA-binding transcriptional regulator [Woeseiaceae bacterium]